MINKYTNKQRGLLAVIMAMVMVFAGAAFVAAEVDATITYADENKTATVTTVEELETVLGEIEGSGTYKDVNKIVLGSDLTVSEDLTIDKNVTIDGNKHTISVDKDCVVMVTSNVEIKNVKFNLDGDGADGADDASIDINESGIEVSFTDVEIVGESEYGVSTIYEKTPTVNFNKVKFNNHKYSPNYNCIAT